MIWFGGKTNREVIWFQTADITNLMDDISIACKGYPNTFTDVRIIYQCPVSPWPILPELFAKLEREGESFWHGYRPSGSKIKWRGEYRQKTLLC